VPDAPSFHRHLNVLSWEGDGKERRFVVDVSEAPAPESIGSVLESAERWPVGRFGVDAGFRWSYDGSALIVDGEPPAEGVIISCNYEPEPFSVSDLQKMRPADAFKRVVDAVTDAFPGPEEALNG
jgi:hypothetical protein